MPISEIDRHKAERTLRNYCAGRTNPAVRDQLEIVYRFDGNFAFIAERRPDWLDESVLRDHDVAKFRFLVKERLWVLYWRDRSLNWHIFADCDPAADIAELLPIVDAEPIFYG